MLKLLERKKDMIAITSKILSLDYFGALLAAVAYPLVLLPQLGVMRSAYLVGLMNVGIAGIMIWLFYHQLSRPKLMLTGVVTTTAVLLAGLFYHTQIAAYFNQKLYQDEVIFSQQTTYQQIVMTRFKNDLRLYLDGNIQFSSIDEYRYHEPLVHVPMLLARQPKQVLILGGGDGLVSREVLKHDSVEKITLVELDAAMIDLAKNHQLLTELNQNSLSHQKVEVVITDAFSFLEKSVHKYDVIIIDLPDPNSEALAKLYSTEFYQLAGHHLSAGGLMVTQATSPYFTNTAFWLIEDTITASGLVTLPYHNDVPAFGEWGFILASSEAVPASHLQAPAMNQLELKFLTPEIWPLLFVFDPDLAAPAADPYQPSTLFNPTILEAYNNEVVRWQ